MHKRILIIIIFLLSLQYAHSQEVLTVSSVDRDTYRMWEQGAWKELNELGNQALKLNIDFYFLRVRMGIAYYERGNYHMAIRHFVRSMKMNADNELVKELLYYAYLYAGRELDARTFAKNFPAALAKTCGADIRHKVDRMDIHYQFAMADNREEVENYINPIDSAIPGTQYLGQERHLFNIRLLHYLSPRVSLYHGYSFTYQNYLVDSRRPGEIKTLSDYGTSTHQYYFGLGIRLARHWELRTGFHYCYLRFPILWREAPTGYGPGSQRRSKGMDHNITGFLSVYKHFPYFTLGGSASYSELNGDNQLQENIHLRFYPLGNLKLYIHSDLSLLEEFDAVYPTRETFGLDVMLGGRLHRAVWAEGYAHFGQISNYVAGDGLLIYNSADLTSQLYGLRLNFITGKKISLSLDYCFEEKRSYFYPPAYTPVMLNEIIYHNHSITGGMSWKF